MNWIRANREWLFSGVGVTIALLAGGFVYRSCGTPATSTPSAVREPVAVAVPEPATFTKPAPDEIFQQIDALPSFQQEGAAEAYKGLRVFWPATFLSLGRQSEPHKWTVELQYGRGLFCFIEINDVDPETDPRLKVARRGDPVNVRGTIVKVGGPTVYLKDASIDFK